MIRLVLLALSVALLSIATAAAGGATTRLLAAPPTTLVLEGSSNVSRWRCQGTSIVASMTVAAPIEKINAVIDHVEDGNIAVWMSQPDEGRFPRPEFEMVIPIAGFHCGNAVMERDMRQALRAGRYPSIEFRFEELRGVIEHDIDRNEYGVTVAGELIMAGVRREIELPVIAQRVGRDRFRIRAAMPLRMTDFGVKPPTALFGIVKAHDDLVVRFDLTMQVSS